MTIEEAIKVLRTESVEIGGNAVSVCRFLEALDMAVKALEDVTGKDFWKNEPLTNAQKIRSMTDEELAWELMLRRCEAVARHHGISSEYPDTQKTILEWLQQPAGEEDKHESN